MDNLISQEQAIDVVMRGAQMGITWTIDALKGLPRVESERKTGHWILYDNGFPWSKYYKCSECGNYIDPSGLNAGRGDANYCPNCGAKMGG